jgi:hypothetical protein
MANADADRATRYASENAMLTIVFLAIAAALVGLAVLGGSRRKADSQQAERKDGWERTMSEILEADLTSLDSVTHGFAGR